MTIVLQNSSSKYPSKASRKFANSQIRGSCFKKWCYQFQIPVQKYLIKGFLVPKLGIFIVAWNFEIIQIWKCWPQIWQLLFQAAAQNEAFLVPNLRVFIFAWHFVVRHIRGSWIEIRQKFFEVPAQKYPNEAVFFWFQICLFLFLYKFFQLDKFVDFKYHNSFLIFQPTNTQINYFWSQI